MSEVGEVAVVEIQKLKPIAADLKIDTSQYKILCRDGTLIATNNFDDIPLDCPLVTIVDGEIVVKRNSGKQRGVVNAINSFDRYFNLNGNPNFKLYDKFNGELNVLFEDSTVGFVSSNSSKFGPSVQNYIRLFENIDSCVEKSAAISQHSANLILGVVALVFALFKF